MEANTNPTADDLSIYERERREKRDKLRELGVDPYGGRTEGVQSMAAVRAQHQADFGQDGGPAVTVAGRVMFRKSFGKLTFMTLRARSPSLVREIALVPPSAWRQVELDVPTRKFRFPSVHDTKVQLAGGEFRQLVIKDLGHEQPTVLVTNDRKTSAAKVITRYARRMLIENALSDAVRFFHMNALSSTVGIKVDFDMALLVIASGLYRLLARKMRGYADAHADRIFRDLIDMPATVTVAADQVTVRFHRRAHLPIIIDSGMLDSPVSVPWWNGAALRLTA